MEDRVFHSIEMGHLCFATLYTHQYDYKLTSWNQHPADKVYVYFPLFFFQNQNRLDDPEFSSTFRRFTTEDLIYLSDDALQAFHAKLHSGEDLNNS
ncbi:hypothetical protein ACLOJK_021670 [Asimina triloba]